MLSLLGFLLPLAGQLAAAYKAKQDATTDQERIEAEERIAQIQAQQRLQAAEAGSRINAFMRAAWTLPFVIYNAKLVLLFIISSAFLNFHHFSVFMLRFSHFSPDALLSIGMSPRF